MVGEASLDDDVHQDLDPRLSLSRVISADMTPDEVAIHTLHGIEFASIEAATAALRQVSAAVEIVRSGPIRVKPSLVKG